MLFEVEEDEDDDDESAEEDEEDDGEVDVGLLTRRRPVGSLLLPLSLMSSLLFIMSFSFALTV